MNLQASAELFKEIADLKDQLEKSDIIANPAERRAVDYLNRLMAANAKTLDREFAALKQFWLSSVDWCSELSRQIEKLIIMHADQQEAEPRPSNHED